MDAGCRPNMTVHEHKHILEISFNMETDSYKKECRFHSLKEFELPSKKETSPQSLTAINLNLDTNNCIKGSTSHSKIMFFGLILNQNSRDT